jgi:5-carboxymethyl-2-hydroxymuconate isomerase
MPHLIVTYTPNIHIDMDVFCRTLCDTLLSMRDEEGKGVYPPGGTRVMAYPASYYAVADGKQDYPFMYLNLRIFGGRPAAVTKKTGDSILAAAKRLLDPIFEQGPVGLTLQIDETPRDIPGQLTMSYEDRHNTLHAIFRK